MVDLFTCEECGARFEPIGQGRVCESCGRLLCDAHFSHGAIGILGAPELGHRRHL